MAINEKQSVDSDKF